MTQFLATWGYLAVFVLTVLESACVPIPSEATLTVSGAFASGALVSGSSNTLEIWAVIAVGILGSLVGSLIAYAVGRTGGRTFIDRHGRWVLLSHDDLGRAERWFAHRGEWVVLYGRVVPVVRTFISLPAGMARMDPAKFTGLSLIGITVWVTTLCWLGYAFAGSLERVIRAIGLFGYVVGASLAVALAVVVVRRYRAGLARRDAPAPEGPGPGDAL